MSRTEKILLPLAALLLGLSAYVQIEAGNAADKGWLLLAAKEWLSGKRLYVDIFELNPPLIVWLYAIPVWIAQHIQLLRDAKMLAILGLLATAFVIRLSISLLARHPAFAGEKHRQYAFALLLAIVFIFLTAPMYFFDREHIMLVLTFPYVLRFMPSLARQALPLPVRVLIGLLAAAGFCMKPHALVVFAVLQLLFILRERGAAILWSVENVIVYLLGGSYVAYVALCMPEYLHIVIPMAMATYYAYSRKADGVFNIILFVVMMGLTFADFRRRYDSPYRRDIYYFLGVSCAWLAYALLNNGWSYTYQPLLSMARITSGWVLMEFLWLGRDAEARGLPARPFLFGARACVFNLAANVAFYAIVFTVFLIPVNCDGDIHCRSSQSFMKQAKAVNAKSFGVMTVAFYKWTGLSRETGARWDTRFNHLWMLPKFILSDEAFARKNQWITDYVSHAYAEDMNQRKPEVMFIDTSPEIFSGHANIDLPAHFSTTPGFREEWKHYARVGVIDACEQPRANEHDADPVKADCRFDIYRRNTAP